MGDAQARVAASFAKQGLMGTLGASLVWVGEGEVHIGLPHEAALAQQHGYLHAGAIASVADSACGYAALSVAPPEFEVVTAEFKINLLRPALGRRFEARAKVVQAGRQLSVCTGEVLAWTETPEPKLVALIQATIVRVPRPE